MSIVMLFSTPDEIVRQLKTLPATPRSLLELQCLLDSPNSQLSDLAAIIRLDRTLTTRLLHAANSVGFGTGEPCENIEDALQRVGFNYARHIVMIVIGIEPLARPLPSYDRPIGFIWEQTIACALAAESIAKTAGENENTAYVAGLLHNIGMVVIDAWVRTMAPGLAFRHNGWPTEWRLEESRHLGYDQAAAGAALLRSWGFPSSMVDAIRNQYRVPTSGDNRLAAILHAARWLRTSITENNPSLLPPPKEVLAVVGTDELTMRSLVAPLAARLESIRNSLAIN
jgi:HD-like signal output (HDOD) protein